MNPLAAPGPVMRALVLAVLLGALTVPAAAQERSDTGRRRPAAPTPTATPKEEAPTPAPAFTAGGENWLAGLSLGLVDAGDLFRVETAGGEAVPWGQDGQTDFTASRFTATVDPGAAVGAFACRRLGGGRWWLRGEVASGATDVAAEALLGQGGEVFHYDRLSFLSGVLAAEARLTAFPSHPYCSLGMTVCRISADENGGLDQTGLGAMAAFGYRQRVGRGFVALETQLRRISLDLSDFRPSVASGPEPGLIYEPADDLWMFELRLVGSRAW